MNTMLILIKRNVKLFFKDKGLFFTSLITPAILLVLYVSFLGNVYVDSIRAIIPDGFAISDELISGFAGGQLISSILAVSCVTVAFCSNMLMVQDKAHGSIKDLTISPVKAHVLSLSYYIATLISTLIVCFAATGICLAYVAFTGFYMSFSDVVLLLLDVVLLCFFGVALSSVINFFLSSQGQISAVGSMVSSTYGFLCGAYMPISQFSEGLQKVISFLPGTHGTVLVRNHAMRGVMEQMQAEGLPMELIEEIKDGFDCNLYLLNHKMGYGGMYSVLIITVAVLVGIYVLLNVMKAGKVKK